MKIKALLIDLDDTLFDHRHSSRLGLEVLRAYYQKLASSSLDELEKENSILLEEVHATQVLTGKLSIEEARAERFLRIFKSHGERFPDSKKYQAAALYRQAYESNIRLVPGAKELLTSLHGKLKIGIVTNNLVSEQKRKLKDLQIESYIDELVTSEEVGVAKPGALIFQTALKRLGAATDETVMIGDSWQSDIVGAHKLGIKCIWLNIYGTPCPDNKIAHEIRSLKDKKHIHHLIFFDKQ